MNRLKKFINLKLQEIDDLPLVVVSYYLGMATKLEQKQKQQVKQKLALLQSKYKFFLSLDSRLKYLTPQQIQWQLAKEAEQEANKKLKTIKKAVQSTRPPSQQSQSSSWRWLGLSQFFRLTLSFRSYNKSVREMPQKQKDQEQQVFLLSEEDTTIEIDAKKQM